jgi:hypothetical protein
MTLAASTVGLAGQIIATMLGLVGGDQRLMNTRTGICTGCTASMDAT